MWWLKHLQKNHKRILYKCAEMCDHFISREKLCTSTAALASAQSSKAFKIPEGELESCNIRNGMRIVSKQTESYTTTIGCFFPGGSMYEEEGERGSALFLQNLLFRRTKQRDEHTLQEDFADIGANLVTIAKRDMFIFYATVQTCKAEKLLELFADVILNGSICDQDIASQRFIILHNLKCMESDYESIVMDYLPTIAYQGTELAKGIYPESCVIKQFCAEKLIKFKDRVLKPCCITLICIGGICLEDLQKYVIKYFDSDGNCSDLHTTPIEGQKWPDLSQFRFSGADFRVRDDDQELGYIAAGIEGPGYAEYIDLCTLNVAKEIVGSWNMSSPGLNHNAPYLAHYAFNTELCHMYKSFHTIWGQTSIWGCYFVSDKMKLDPMMRLIQEEWRKLCTIVTEKEVQRAKNRCKTIELMKLHEPEQHFLDIAIHLARKGCYKSLQERIRIYDNISVSTIIQVGDKYIYDQCPAVVAVGRIENLLDYNVIRARMYSLLY